MRETYEQVTERMTKRTCKWCGRKFHVPVGEAKRHGRPDCEPQLPLPKRAA